MTEKWIAFMEWCRQNPYSTIERLEIVGGEPNLIIVRKQLTQVTQAKVKIKFNNGKKAFTSK